VRARRPPAALGWGLDCVPAPIAQKTHANPVGGRGISAFSPRFFSAEGIFTGEARGGRARRRRRPWPGLNPRGKGRRIHPVAVNPATGFGDPSKIGRASGRDRGQLTVAGAATVTAY